MCEKFKTSSVTNPLICYNILVKPFVKIGAYYCKWAGKSYLVIVTIYTSKWIEANIMVYKTAFKLMNKKVVLVLSEIRKF